MSSCASCSTSLKPGARFCHGCGKPALSKAAATPPKFGAGAATTTTTATTPTTTTTASTLSPSRFGAAAAPKPATTTPATTTTAARPAATTASPGLTWSQRQAQAKAESDAAAAERATAQAATAEKAAAERAAAERAAAERAAAERAAAERAAADKAAADKAAADKAAADKAAADKAAAERAAAAAPTPAPAPTPAATTTPPSTFARPGAARGGLSSSTSSPSRPGFIPAASSPAISRGAARPGPATLQVPGGPKKRHSKINMDVSEIKESLAGLDVEGIQVTHERPGASASREAPPSTVSSPSLAVLSPSAASASPSASASSSSSPAPAAGGGRGGGLANRFQQMMAEKAEAERQAERQKIRGRRKGATEFVDKQIRMLISILQNHGGSITYGDLFKETAESMPALSATLAVAQKRGVMSYEGAMLMQGVHDSVKITLLRDEIEDSAVFVSVYGIAPVKEVEGPKIENCHVCSKQVYPTERIAASGKTMHKACFRCCTCNGVLKLSQFAFNGGKFYCDTHFKELFSRGGGAYNF